MPQNVAEFEWWVPPRGHRWREGVRMPDRPVPAGAEPIVEFDTPQTRALEQVDYERGERSRWYVPDSALFRTFADLDGTADAALTFADRYGPLDLQHQTIDPEDPWYAYEDAAATRRDPETWPEIPETPRWESTDETLAGWQLEIGMMRTCIDLYEMLEAPDAEHRLRWHFSRFHERVVDGVFCVFEYRTHTDQRALVNAGWSARIELTDASEYRKSNDDTPIPSGYGVSVYHHFDKVASFDLPELYQHDDSRNLVEYARVMLSALVNAHLTGRIETMLLVDPKTKRPVLFTMPNSLIGALWLQLAQSIDGHKHFRQCENCRSWFELAPDKARADKEYCSQACRSRAYRRRRRNASE